MEFVETCKNAGLLGKATLYIVDDFSTDGTVSLLEELQRQRSGIDLRIIRAPTNFGNQGAMFHGLRRVEIGPEDVLITFDSDGEDDVAQIPSVLDLGAKNPGKIVLIERGRRTESVLFKLLFACYKMLFRFLTRQTVVPNNFLLIPGLLVPVIQRSPLAAVHFAYAILKLGPRYVATVRARRPRYGGRSSQNMFMLVSHGLVGIMLFYEVVVAKIFMLLFLFGTSAACVVALALAVPPDKVVVYRALGAVATGAGAGVLALLALLLSAALALLFKLAIFVLVENTVEQPRAPKPRAEGASLVSDAAPRERRDREAS